MAKKSVMSKVGGWAFIVGIIVALAASFIGPWAVPVLVVVGLIVGFLNVKDEETKPFLFAAIAIMVAAFTAGNAVAADLGTLGMVGNYLAAVLKNINVLVFPATIVVALKSIMALARD